MTSDAYAEYIRTVVDQAPPLSEATRSRLATILRQAIAATPATTAAVDRAPETKAAKSAVTRRRKAQTQRTTAPAA